MTYPIPPLPHTITSCHPLAPPARAACSRRPLAPPALAARSRRPLAPPSRATRHARGHWGLVRLLLSLGAARLLSSSSRFRRAPTGGKTDRPPKPPTSLLRHLLAFTGTTTGKQPINQPHQAPNPQGGQSRPTQYGPFRTPTLRATLLRRRLAPLARAARSRRPLAPPALAAHSRRPLAPPSRATRYLTARSRRPLTPPAHAVRSR